MDEDELIDRWGETGLLDGVGDEIKGPLVTSFEVITRYILDLDERWYLIHIETIAYPALRRIYDNGGRMVGGPEDFIRYMDEWFRRPNNWNLLHSHNSYNSMDIEAELTLIFTEEYVEYSNSGNWAFRYLKKHRL